MNSQRLLTSCVNIVLTRSLAKLNINRKTPPRDFVNWCSMIKL